MVAATGTQQILGLPTGAAMFLVMTVRRGSENAVRDVLADLAGARRTVGFRAPHGALTVVVGIGSQAWDRLYGDPRPAKLHPFQRIEGSKHTAVSTPGDVLVHLKARHLDLCFELAHHLTDDLRGHADVVDEVHGFRYFDQRDLLGFVDGTENPEGDEAEAAVHVGDEDPPFAGGSYVIVQKYLHDLDAWGAIGTEEQERVIGRRKLSDIELDDEEKPANSHVALNTIEDDNGDDLDIFRDNMPFGSVADGEFGTYFIGYAADPGVTEQMLRNMFLGDPPGNYDRILDFSTARTGGLFFVPPQSFLEDPSTPASPDEPGAPEDVPRPAESDPPPAPDASLHIGSLRRSTS